MRKAFFVLTAVLCVSVIAVLAVEAADVTLVITNNAEEDIAGYKIYYSTRAGNAPYKGGDIDQGRSPIDVPVGSLVDQNHPEIKLTGLSAKTYRFAATAYDDVGNESGYSNEVVYAVEPIVTAPPRGLTAAFDATTNMIALTWMSPGGSTVDYWKIYYREAGTIDWVELDEVPYSQGPSLTKALTAVANGEHKTIEFTIVAFRNGGQHSDDSAVVSVEIDRKPPPPPVLTVKVNVPVE